VLEKENIEEKGRYGLISHLTAKAGKINRETGSSIGDDAAIILNSGDTTVISTDLLLEGIHFSLVYNPMKHLGYKSIIRGISDIYAMNCKPLQVLVSIGISSRVSLSSLEEFYEGVMMACRQYGVDLAGGDTSSSMTGFTVSVTATGHPSGRQPAMRNGAKPNELVCVTGDLGAAYMGLQVLERERKLFEEGSGIQPDLAGYEYIIERQLKPEVPAGILDELEKKGLVPTSMTDLSDSLASSLLHICRSSATGCRIYADKLPVDIQTATAADEMGIEPLTAALNGGEDFELLFTLPLDRYDSIISVKGVKVIGHITQQEYGCYAVLPDGSETEIVSRGWGMKK
jgi:thiamine-monophosphate kinase